VLNSYQKYYNEARTHLSLHKDAPIPRAVGLAMPSAGHSLAASHSAVAWMQQPTDCARRAQPGYRQSASKARVNAL